MFRLGTKSSSFSLSLESSSRSMNTHASPGESFGPNPPNCGGISSACPCCFSQTRLSCAQLALTEAFSDQVRRPCLRLSASKLLEVFLLFHRFSFRAAGMREDYELCHSVAVVASHLLVVPYAEWFWTCDVWLLLIIQLEFWWILSQNLFLSEQLCLFLKQVSPELLEILQVENLVVLVDQALPGFGLLLSMTSSYFRS